MHRIALFFKQYDCYIQHPQTPDIDLATTQRRNPRKFTPFKNMLLVAFNDSTAVVFMVTLKNQAAFKTTHCIAPM